MQKYTLAPWYKDDFCRRIGVLQQLQTLLGNDATPGDVTQLVQSFQQGFGVQRQLESVIQSQRAILLKLCVGKLAPGGME